MSYFPEANMPFILELYADDIGNLSTNLSCYLFRFELQELYSAQIGIINLVG